MDVNYLSTNLKKLRKDNKLSQSKLGEMLGVSGAYIQQLEKGIKTNPSFDLIYKISKYFDIAPLQLLEYDINNKHQEFPEYSELSNSLRNAAIKKAENYNTKKYFEQLFKKPSEWEENSISTAIGVLLKEIGYNVHDFTEDEYKKIEKSIFEYLKTIVFIKNTNSK
ncbi:helix-turn-helix domain-containing protein [Clostridium neonatale]|uniref:XRE family transcriptional regulator n=1 Tax=Clostridium neonatale TaxID=137838 RepID=A0AA86MDX4_9CLOT|nr:helix-turn-helix transcriptional regulator [Clostridium neonatale]MBP8312062.1 helix-turn-helix transcriptional regulator [Clostridium neonatale]CAG9703380.1 XRE family transcriptional regulator [Clostridium neonatale]CAI3544501.1 XRE family transcriptional regulator [Clostridium neonatale]CAI3550007.1 XRE family transcriptional regulator [Clostridium neonatale]CAI3584761.1 XRE family transcriptional regulator [Clostridium neonatale]